MNAFGRFWRKCTSGLTKLAAANAELAAAGGELRADYDELARERELAGAVLDIAPGLLYIYDDAGRLVRWNKNLETATGYSAAEIVHLSRADWFTDEDSFQRANRLAAEVRQGGTAFAEAMLQRKDGRKIPYYFSAVKALIGSKPYVVGIGIDISERKSSEEQLRQQERQLQANFEELTAMHQELTAMHEELIANEAELRQRFDELARVNQDLANQNAVLEALQETAAGLMAQTDVDSMLMTILHRAVQIAGTPHSTIAFKPNDEERFMYSRGGTGLFAGHTGLKISTEFGVIQQVIATGQSVVMPNYNTWEKKYPLADLDPIHVFVEVPLKRQNEVIGFIGLAYTDEDCRIGDKEIALLNRFGELASIALDNIRRHNELLESRATVGEVFNAAARRPGDRRRRKRGHPRGQPPRHRDLRLFGSGI